MSSFPSSSIAVQAIWLWLLMTGVIPPMSPLIVCGEPPPCHSKTLSSLLQTTQLLLLMRGSLPRPRDVTECPSHRYTWRSEGEPPLRVSQTAHPLSLSENEKMREFECQMVC